jgi:hypothetical protein
MVAEKLGQLPLERLTPAVAVAQVRLALEAPPVVLALL